MFARFLYCQQQTLAGRKVDPLSIERDYAPRARWDACIHELLNEEPEFHDEERTRIKKRVHELSGASQIRFRDFWLQVENTEKLPHGRLGTILTWGGKMCGQILRIATHLHRVDQCDKGHSLYAPIELKWIDTAIELAWIYSEHTKYVYGLMFRDGRQANLIYVLDRVRAMPVGTTVSELNENTKKKGIDGVKDLQNLLELLAERGYLRLVEQPSPPVGRRPSPIIELNPAISIQEIQETPNQEKKDSSLDFLEEDCDYEEEERKALQELT